MRTKSLITHINLFDPIRPPLPPATAGDIIYVCAAALSYTIIMSGLIAGVMILGGLA